MQELRWCQGNSIGNDPGNWVYGVVKLKVAICHTEKAINRNELFEDVKYKEKFNSDVKVYANLHKHYSAYEWSRCQHHLIKICSRIGDNSMDMDNLHWSKVSKFTLKIMF